MASYKNDKLIIKTPKGKMISHEITRGKNKGKVKLRIEWEKGFGPKWTSNLNTVQAKFDEEVLRVTQPYVPYKTHLLQQSAVLSSNIGGGELVWSTPYAAAQYYNTADSRKYDGKAGGHWGERMKADNLTHLSNFVKGAMKKVDK